MFLFSVLLPIFLAPVLSRFVSILSIQPNGQAPPVSAPPEDVLRTLTKVARVSLATFDSAIQRAKDEAARPAPVPQYYKGDRSLSAFGALFLEMCEPRVHA